MKLLNVSVLEDVPSEVWRDQGDAVEEMGPKLGLETCTERACLSGREGKRLVS